MKLSKIAIGVFFIVFLVFSLNTYADSYKYKTTAAGITFEWTVDGDKLNVQLSAKTKGWVAIGFNPSRRMKDADYVIGFVKKGKANIRDDFGTSAVSHKEDTKVGGKDNIMNPNGSEKGGKTTISFTIPLNSGDSKDSVLDPNGTTVVLLAAGKRDSFSAGHGNKRAILEVNLGNGTVTKP